MTPDQKVQFITNLMNSVRDELVDMVNSGEIPEDWDGHELREILARKFDRERTMLLRDKRSRRYREYERVVLTTPRL